MEEQYIYIDGSCLFNGTKKSVGGYGVFFGDDDPRNVSKKLSINNVVTKITNNTAELMACLEALTILETNPTGKKNFIVTDSKYLYQSCIDWIPVWEKNNWKKSDGKIVDNLELIKSIREKHKKVRPLLKHVNSHKDEPSDKESQEWRFWYGNMMADKLATQASKTPMAPE